jgi:hypothetical protein
MACTAGSGTCTVPGSDAGLFGAEPLGGVSMAPVSWQVCCAMRFSYAEQTDEHS